MIFLKAIWNENKCTVYSLRINSLIIMSNFEIVGEEVDQLFANSHSHGPLFYWPYVRAVAQKNLIGLAYKV